ncbi:MAG: CheR family methyltransferase [Myxococcota bacterium]
MTEAPWLHWAEHTLGIHAATSSPAELTASFVRAAVAVGAADAHELLARLRRGDAQARSAVIDALLVGESYVLRHPDQFEAVARHLAARSGPVTLWSAGCSGGEEAWSLAIVAAEVRGAAVGREVTVLGTDINERSPRRAAAGRYRPWSLRNLSTSVRDRLVRARRATWSSPTPCAPSRTSAASTCCRRPTRAGPARWTSRCAATSCSTSRRRPPRAPCRRWPARSPWTGCWSWRPPTSPSRSPRARPRSRRRGDLPARAPAPAAAPARRGRPPACPRRLRRRARSGGRRAPAPRHGAAGRRPAPAAVEEVRAVLAGAPDDPVANTLLACSLARLGQADRAIAAAERALRVLGPRPGAPAPSATSCVRLRSGALELYRRV